MNSQSNEIEAEAQSHRLTKAVKEKDEALREVKTTIHLLSRVLSNNACREDATARQQAHDMACRASDVIDAALSQPNQQGGALAAVLTQLNSPLELVELIAPEPDYGQVRVRLRCSGICGSQLQEIRGEKGGPLPHLLGHEGCGIVESIGPKVRTVAVGQKVVLHWRKGDGIESECPTYEDQSGRRIGAGHVTTFNEVAIVSENRVTAVPDDAPDELCALLGCGLSTALGVIEHEANLKMGESVLIIGCGGLGLNLIRAARMRKASQIWAVDTYGEKCKVALDAGADEFVAGALGFSRPILETFPFNVIIDTSGDPRAISMAIQALAPSGRFIMVGQPKPGQFIQIPNARSLFNGDGCKIMATQGGGFRPHIDIFRYYQLWKSGQMDLAGIITHRLPLAKINEGIELVKTGNAGRVLIEMP